MKKRSLFLMLLLALLVPWAANAQTVTIGTGTTGYTSTPVDNYYNYSFTEILYTSADIAAGNPTVNTITSMAFDSQNGANGWSYDITVYMKNVDDTSIESFIAISDSDKVFEGTITPATGWVTFDLDNAFTYDNTKNLLVAVNKTKGTKEGTSTQYAGSTYKWNHTATTGTNTVILAHNDSNKYTPTTSLPTSIATTGSYWTKTSRPNVQLTFSTPTATPKPTNFAVSNILHNQAELSWTENGTATSWQICVNDDEANLIPTTDNPHTLTGLTPLTAYTVKVRSVGTPNSDWSTSKTFTTTAQATAVGDSWSDDFEGTECGWELINGTLTNANWAWGTAVNNGGSHAIYISNDGGTTNNYNTSGYAKVFATKLLNFTEGKFTFSYDWKGTGESTYDFMRVALVPASQTLTAGTDHSTIGTTTLPTGWIALDGSNILNQQSTWTSKEVTTNVTAGNYYLVLAWRQDSGGGTNPPAAVDNVSITRMACPYDVTGLAVATSPAVTETTATVTWTAGDATQWQVAYSTNSNFEGATQEIVSAASYNMTGLTAATQYYVKVRAYCGGEDYGSWCNAISFYTECPQYTTIPAEGWTENFDDYTLTSTYTPSSRTLPVCWDYINGSTYSTNKWYPTMHYYSSTNYANSTPNYVRFYVDAYSGSNYDPKDQYLILPAMQDVAGLRIKLHARAYNTGSTYDATFKVGVMTDPADANTFVEIDSKTPTTTSYELYTIPFSSYTGTGNHIAIMIEAPATPTASYTHAYRAVCIDDITVEEIPSCLEPADLAEVPNTATSNSVTFGWTAVNNETTWKVQYKKSDATDWTTVSDPVATNPYTLPGLDHSSTYQVRVAAWCTPSNPEGISGYTEPITVHTECEAITSFPWNETFESYPANTNTSYSETYKFDNPCWLNEHLVDGTGSGTETWFQVYSGSTANNNTNRLQLPDMMAGTQTELRLPEMTLATGTNYQFVIDVYRDNSSKENEGIRIYASTNGEVANAQELGFIPHYYNYAPAEAAIGWNTYEFAIPFTGTCYIIIVGESQWGTATYMDNLTVEEIPACSRPSALACTAKTAHTATFSWTNGAEGQNAWQIVYSTTADFDPATVTPVDVTTNPATISGLTVGTTYYAYVRANCDTDGYSPWSRKSCTFTTVASGANPPTGLAVDHATITSSQATANWTGVATNDYHASYDLYYALATVTEVPAEPAAPNLIAGITATSQVISDLDPETDYKVWVRDNCGTDGLSAWTSPVTFTTSSACETPDGLAASDVTNESATITWNTYGLTTFNLRYRTDTEEWEVKKIVACPYTIEGLTGNTPYQVQVQASCNTDEWSSVFNFTTACDAVTTFPWGEDFESYPATTSTYNSSNHDNDLVDNCWVNEHISGDGTRLFQVSSYSSTTGNTTKKLVLPDMSNGTMTKLCLPAMSLPNANYQFAIDVYRNISTENYGEGIRVFVSTNGEIEGATELAFISRSYTTTDGGLIPAENTSGWYTYELPIGISGTCYIILRGESKYGSSTYMDNFIVEEIPTCARPSGLAKSDVTNYSATLTWTPGGEGQTHWQIAYKNTSFNPNAIGFDLSTVTTLDIDASNTYTFNHTLTPSTIYYMYVRANCGDALNPNYSKWCATGVNFTTLVATPAPSGSSFTASNPGPHNVDLVWNAGGGDNESWDLYYVASEDTPTETPDDDTEPSKTVSTLPTTQAPYTLTGLNDETKYYIWVRANYGTDGTSSWVGPRNFTTLEACPAPTSIAAGNLTQNTADLTWTGYSDSYNIQYRTAECYDFYYFEGFEGGTMPTGWITIPSSDNYYEWDVTSGTGNSSYSSAATDSYNAGLYINTSTYPKEAWLITPAIDLSGLTSATLTFNYINPYYYGGQDELYVYYRVNNGEWNPLGAYTSDQSTWTSSGSIALTGFAANYQIGFKGTNDPDGDYGYGIGIDDVTIIGGEQHDAGEWSNPALTSNTESKQLTGLTAGRKYEVQIQGVCDGTAGDWSETTSFTLPFTKTIEADTWYFIASPVGNAPTNMGDLSDLYFYDEQDHFWRNKKVHEEGFDFALGKGYLAANAVVEGPAPDAITLTFTGAPITITGETYNVPVTFNNTTSTGESNPLAGWNLVGNPFACNAKVDRPFFTVSGKTLVAFSANTSIAPCEGVMVQAAAIDIDQNTINYENYDEEVIFTKVNSSTPVQPNQLQMTVAQQVVNRNGVSAEIIDNAIVSFDKGNLLEKFVFNADLAKLYIPQDNKEFAIISSEGQGEMPVNFRANENGSYTITVNAEGVDMAYLHLIDNMTGNDIDLLQTPSYTFNATTTDYSSRFKLVFCTGVNSDSDSFAFFSNGNWIINNEGQATLQVIDLTGRILSSETVNGSVSKAINAAPGVYMIRLINGDNVKVQKIVVR